MFTVCACRPGVRGHSVLLVGAAEAMALTQGDVGLVHRVDVGLCRRDNAVAEVSATNPPPAERETTCESNINS